MCDRAIALSLLELDEHSPHMEKHLGVETMLFAALSSDAHVLKRDADHSTMRGWPWQNQNGGVYFEWCGLDGHNARRDTWPAASDYYNLEAGVVIETADD